MKVIMVAKTFMKGHPLAGEPTWFVQKILHSFLPPQYKPATQVGYPKKFHTIRKGNRFKVGEIVSLRTWEDKPYRSKQQEFARPTVKKIWTFKIFRSPNFILYEIAGEAVTLAKLKRIAENDGLELEDFQNWFDKDFIGQIICWTENINY